MDQSAVVWTLILLAFAMATLPFAADRPFLVLPWFRAVGNRRPWLCWLESLAFFIVLAASAYLASSLVGKAIFTGSDLSSLIFFMARVVGVSLLVALVLAYAGWRYKGGAVRKTFFDRLLELLVFYGLVGVLGFAFESSIGNVFVQGWEFYAITLSLFLVLAYPGFVYRYLLRRRKSISKR